ncbi:hypothetical protein niasHT_007983 [Heterodera trifolii]|uniref:Uncharacterized protein n=1 Tax=Heterodera trifolii TaxID=157864 RepID=A0ABD2LZL6_9BILA
MNIFPRRQCFSPWHLSFFILFILLLLYCVRQRFLLKSVGFDGKMPNQSDNGNSFAENGIALKRFRRRRLTPSKLDLFGNFLSRENFISAEQMTKLKIIFSQYNRNRKSANQTIGMRYVHTFLPGEVNLTKMDRETLKRLQTMEIVDAMSNSGGQLVTQQIEKVIRRHQRLNKALTQSETRHELQTDAWDVCLGEQHTLCNGHLSAFAPFWHCVCSVSPFRRSAASAPLRRCSSAFLIRNVPSKVLTVPLLFPLPALFGFQSLFPQLVDSFLAHWLSTTFGDQIKFDQVLLLRKQCLDEQFFVVQFAFLTKLRWANRKVAKNGQVTDSDLLDIKNAQFRARRRALWTDQTVLEIADVEEVSDLLPEEMLETEFFREKVAKLDDVSQCLPPWDYKSFVLCHPRNLLFILVASVFVLGVPAGAFRFYHRVMTAAEEQRKGGRRSRSSKQNGERRRMPKKEERREEEKEQL